MELAGQRLLVELAGDDLGHGAVGAQQHRGGHAQAAERVERAARRVEGEPVADSGPSGERKGRAALVTLVDANKRDPLAEALVDPLEGRHLGGAERAPRRPEVDHGRAADQVGQAHLAAAGLKVGQFDPRGGLADPGRALDHRGRRRRGPQRQAAGHRHRCHGQGGGHQESQPAAVTEREHGDLTASPQPEPLRRRQHLGPVSADQQ